jgi:hypothetical protein
MAEKAEQLPNKERQGKNQLYAKMFACYGI